MPSTPPQTDQPDIRYRQTTSVCGPPEPPVEAASTEQVAAAPPSRDDVDMHAGQETASQLQEQEVSDVQRQLLDAVINTLNWDNDIRIDPVVIFIIITLLYL